MMIFAHFARAHPAPNVTVLIPSSVKVSRSFPALHFVMIIPAVDTTPPSIAHPSIAPAHPVAGVAAKATIPAAVDPIIPTLCQKISRFLAFQSSVSVVPITNMSISSALYQEGFVNVVFLSLSFVITA